MNEARFWANVDWNGPVPAHRPDLGPCALWTGHSDGRYGTYSVAHGRQQKAHRIASEILDGPIPAGVCVLHHCDVTLCVRRTHLFRGTQVENIADMVAKGRQRGARGDRNTSRLHPDRQVRGERVASSKLTRAQVDDVRARYAAGARQVDLAAMVGVSDTNISYIVRGKAWR